LPSAAKGFRDWLYDRDTRAGIGNAPRGQQGNAYVKTMSAMLRRVKKQNPGATADLHSWCFGNLPVEKILKVFSRTA